jgi:hypothetical protein
LSEEWNRTHSALFDAGRSGIGYPLIPFIPLFPQGNFLFWVRLWVKLWRQIKSCFAKGRKNGPEEWTILKMDIAEFETNTNAAQSVAAQSEEGTFRI